VARVRIPIAGVTETDDETIDARRGRALEELRQTDQSLLLYLSMWTPKRGSTENAGGAPRRRLSVTSIA